jgi:hypothetical protein
VRHEAELREAVADGLERLAERLDPNVGLAAVAASLNTLVQHAERRHGDVERVGAGRDHAVQVEFEATRSDLASATAHIAARGKQVRARDVALSAERRHSKVERAGAGRDPAVQAELEATRSDIASAVARIAALEEQERARDVALSAVNDVAARLTAVGGGAYRRPRGAGAHSRRDALGGGRRRCTPDRRGRDLPRSS